MTARKNTTDKVEVVRKSDEELAAETAAQDTAPADATPEKKGGAETETFDLEVTLSNGARLTLDVIKDQDDWAYEAVEALAELNYPVLVNAIMTRGSKYKLKAAGARVRDFEMITEKLTEALGVIQDERESGK